ncbi:MAG TPA: hypothetical protein VJH90_00125 [archaeon]|nr:hypothetical protein [archaeon]
MGFNERENYLNYIGFSYNAEKEKWLRRFCIECLKLEGVNATYKEKNKDGIAVVTNWYNYYKLWNIDVFGACRRKKKDLIEILTSRNIYCCMNNKFRIEFFRSLNMKQKEIAKLINSWQGNVCKTIQGKHLLTIRQSNILQSSSDFTTNNIIGNIFYIRIGKSKFNLKKDIKYFFSLV